MTNFQLVMVGLGALLGVSAFWPQIKEFLDGRLSKPDSPETNPVQPSSPEKPVTIKPECPEIPKCPDGCPISLAYVVSRWEELKEMCEELNLDAAATELDKLFPLLVQETPDEPKT